MKNNSTAEDAFRATGLSTMVGQFQAFFRTQASSGIFLLACTFAALGWANSPWSGSYHDFWDTHLTIGIGDLRLSKSLLHWINDGLMAIFFFVVGLEIKREILAGELATLKNAMLPIAAALGGMIVPALIYLAFNAGASGAPGWGIPMATDIAFSLGVLALLGSRAPLGLKVFLTAFAIVDDLGAVLVIALFYTAELSPGHLLAGAVVLALLIGANLLNIRRPGVYGALGIVLWLFFLKSGVHAAIAGVVLAMIIPARAKILSGDFVRKGTDLLSEFDSTSGSRLLSQSQLAAIHALGKYAEGIQTPMQRLEHGLHPWVSYFIMPLFAFANAGVTISGSLADSAGGPVALGIILGLFGGKQLGIFTFSWLSVRFRLASLPRGVTWSHVYGAGLLGGIGFTMSLFIGGLAFSDALLLNEAKIGILAASLISGLGGIIFLWLRSARNARG